VATPKKHRYFRDRIAFVLEKKRWERFLGVLDRPVRITPEFRRLFSKPRVFSGQ